MEKKCPFIKDICLNEECMFWENTQGLCIFLISMQKPQQAKMKKISNIAKSMKSEDIGEKTNIAIMKGEITNILKRKLLTNSDIENIFYEFNLGIVDFNNSKDYIIECMAKEIIDKHETKRFKLYMKKFPDAKSGRRGIDYKRLENQINLSGNKQNIS